MSDMAREQLTANGEQITAGLPFLGSGAAA